MIRGAHTLNLDSKNRLAIPSRYRESMVDGCAGKLVVTVNNTNEPCLWLYPLPEWEKVERSIVALSDFDRNHQKLKRFMLGHANDVEMDGSGRILIPAPLREFARLTKAAMFVGQGNKYEIWAEELWHARRQQWQQEEMDLQNISVEMEQLSL